MLTEEHVNLSSSMCVDREPTCQVDGDGGLGQEDRWGLDVELKIFRAPPIRPCVLRKSGAERVPVQDVLPPRLRQEGQQTSNK